MSTNTNKKSVVTGNEGRQQPQPASPAVQRWTPKEAAAWANYKSPVSILRAFRRGELAGYKLNARTIRFDPADVQAWFLAAKVAGTAQH